jgi:glutathione peroxidase
MRRKLFITFGLVVVLCILIKRQDMNWRQSILKLIYPITRKLAEASGNKTTVALNEKGVLPAQPIYELSATGNTGEPISLSQFRGKKLLIVNSASGCGYTGQLEELQELQEMYSDRLAVIAFPANDFKNQETGTDADIAKFCKINFGVTFPLMQKSSVIKSSDQHPVYKWLTDASKNGWNQTAPEWNFSKYLLDENGKLLGYFGPAISPLNEQVVQKIKG